MRSRKKKKKLKKDEQLDRIEKRLEELRKNQDILHEHILQLQKNHHQTIHT